jgi:hypothetical protein
MTQTGHAQVVWIPTGHAQVLKIPTGHAQVLKILIGHARVVRIRTGRAQVAKIPAGRSTNATTIDNNQRAHFDRRSLISSSLSAAAPICHRGQLR